MGKVSGYALFKKFIPSASTSAKVPKAVPDEKFDLILLDPPFKKNLLNDCLRLIDERDLLTSDAKVYIESAADQPVDLSAWQVIKETNVGQVIGRLIIQRFDQI